MASEKTVRQKYRCFLSDYEHPVRLIFETRYYANKYRETFYSDVGDKYVMIQKDPFGQYDGFVIIFLRYEAGADII